MNRTLAEIMLEIDNLKITYKEGQYPCLIFSDLLGWRLECELKEHGLIVEYELEAIVI